MTDGFVIHGKAPKKWKNREKETWAYGQKKSKKQRLFIAFVSFFLSVMIGVGAAAWYHVIGGMVSDSGRAKFGAATNVDATAVVSGLVPTTAEIVGTILPGDTGKAVTVKFSNTGPVDLHLLELHANQAGSFGNVSGSDGSCRSGQLTETFASGNYSGDLTTHDVTGLSILLPAGQTTTATIPGFLDASPSIPVSCANGIITVTVNAYIDA